MLELSIEGVRCFRDHQTIPIRPVTLLVGENSAGKSTVLAMARAAWDVAYGSTEPDFNEQPFELGGYDAIAHYHGGQGKRVQNFSIGGRFVSRGQTPSTKTFKGVFTEHQGQPLLAHWAAQHADRGLFVASTGTSDFQIAGSRGAKTVFDEKVSATRRSSHLAFDAFMAVRIKAMQEVDTSSPQKSLPLARLGEEWFDLIPGSMAGFESRPFAGAPIRSRPERTYDPKRGLREPEGSHVPMDLATLNATEPEAFKDLIQHMASFGKDGNLFTKLEVKRLGKKAGDPFQLMVAVDKFAFNVRDVGYGVSQILPILVDTLRAPNRSTFLLQQPEVHLHPRAQAALGSLLVEHASRYGQTFIVETHSDHLVDRVRMEVRDGNLKLKPSDVVILYFERSGGKATIHPIEMDASGNFVDVPKGYRDFFLEEERRLLGLGE
jgi:hypothetical protein